MSSQHRLVRYGGILWILAVIASVAGMVVAQIGYGSSYSLTQNHISDLGAVHCGTSSIAYLYNGYICSPWHDVFNATIALEGIMILLGILLVRSGLPFGRTEVLGLGFLAASGIGSIGVGLFPEDANLVAHSISALLIFVGGNAALIVLGFSTFRAAKWRGYSAYSVVSGVVGLVAFFLFVFMISGPLGVGGMERLVVFPLLLWTVITGGVLARTGNMTSLGS